MKKIYLHMGFHKTATTSFQESCRNNITILARQGYIYPIIEYKNNENKTSISNHSIPILSCFGNNPEKYHPNIRLNIKNISQTNNYSLQQLQTTLNENENIIISGEGISLLKLTELQRLTDFLKNHNKKIVPIVCVRSPYDFHNSWCQQRIKTGNFLDFTSLESQIDKIKNLKEVFKEDLIFIPFKQACRHSNGPVAYLLNQMGVQTDSIKTKESNVSESNEYIRIKNELNKLEPSIKNGQMNPRHHKLKSISGSKFLLTENELTILRPQLDTENAFFKDALGSEYCDDEIKFSEELILTDLIAKHPDLFSSPKSELSNKSINMLRDMAMTMENQNIQAAYELMALAYKARPNGPVIAQKYNDYKKTVEASA